MIKYETFVLNNPAGSFFQSQAFAEFQKKIPYRGKTWAFSIINYNDIKSSCLIIKQKLPFGYCWLWVPCGPLGEFSKDIFEDLAKTAEEERALFARIEPPADWKNEYIDLIKRKWAVKPSPHRFTPEHTLILDIAKSEKEILVQMKPKGRYNVGIAKKRGVSVHQWEGDEAEFEKFYEILKKTASRDAFGVHPAFFYKKLLETFGKDQSILFLATEPVKKKIIAGIIVIFYQGTATYYYGASDHHYRNLMAPYLLQWEGILEAKRRGMTQYDFLGIAPENVGNHSWAGVSEFKKKFGGRGITYPPAFDIVYRPFLYTFYKYRSR